MIIHGFQSLSTIDYPGKLASVVYVGGCNFRCGYCHNVDAVLHPKANFSEAEIIKEIASASKKLIDGVVVTGGEPTIYQDLPLYLADLKDLQLAVKLDTNGYNPDMLKEVIERHLVDYVAMDLKTSLDSYRLVIENQDIFDEERIKRSLYLLKHADIQHEIRITLCPPLCTPEHLKAMKKLIVGTPKLVLQQFRPTTTLDPEMAKIRPYSLQHIQSIKEFFADSVGEVTIKNT